MANKVVKEFKIVERLGEKYIETKPGVSKENGKKLAIKLGYKYIDLRINI